MKKLIKTLDEIWRFYEHDKQSLIEFFRSGYKHFHPQAKEKEADEMEKELNLKRKAVEQIKSLLTPVPEAFHCPSCGREWDTKKHNACQCGAIISKSIPEDKLNEFKKKWRGRLESSAIFGTHTGEIDIDQGDFDEMLKAHDELKEGRGNTAEDLEEKENSLIEREKGWLPKDKEEWEKEGDND